MHDASDVASLVPIPVVYTLLLMMRKGYYQARIEGSGRSQKTTTKETQEPMQTKAGA